MQLEFRLREILIAINVIVSHPLTMTLTPSKAFWLWHITEREYLQKPSSAVQHRTEQYSTAQYSTIPKETKKHFFLFLFPNEAALLNLAKKKYFKVIFRYNSKVFESIS